MAEEGGKAERKEERRISAGSYDLNKLLYGGYEKDIITTIYGPAGSGKTNFCLLAAVSQAKKGNKIIFIDTEGGFSVERVKQIVGEGHEEILKNIIILSPTNFKEQKEDFEKVFPRIKKGNFDLLIVDGMAMLYRLELGDAAQLDENVEEDEKTRKKRKKIIGLKK